MLLVGTFLLLLLQRPLLVKAMNFLGVLVFQLSLDRINSIMQVTAGMGATGETYLGWQGTLPCVATRVSMVIEVFYKLLLKQSLFPMHFSGLEGVHVSQDYRGRVGLSLLSNQLSF